jgi:hypothetical protein
VIFVGKSAGAERRAAVWEAVRLISVPGSTDLEHRLLDASDVALVMERLCDPLANEIRQAKAASRVFAELACLNIDEQRIVKSVEPPVGVGVQVHAQDGIQWFGRPGVKRLDSLLQLVSVHGELMSTRAI